MDQINNVNIPNFDEFAVKMYIPSSLTISYWYHIFLNTKRISEFIEAIFMMSSNSLSRLCKKYDFCKFTKRSGNYENPEKIGI